jgi:hypothetical protein
MLLILAAVPFLASAGDPKQGKDTIKYANPSVVGMPTGKGVELRGEYITPFHVSTTSHIEGMRNANGYVRKNERMEAKLRFPVVNTPKFKAVLGGSYSKEEFYFDKDNNPSYPLYQSLEDKSLKITGATLYLLKSMNEKHFWAVRAAWRLQGDFNKLESPMSDFAKYTVAVMYGTVKNSRTVWAPGLHYSDNFGSRGIFPVFMYNRTFNTRWGIESTLPVEVKLRRNFSDNSYGYIKAEAYGAKYNIRLNSPLYPRPSVFLEQSEARLTVSFEQRLFWWVWVNIEGGARYNITSAVTLKDRIFDYDQILQRNEFGTAGIVMGSIFIRPSKKTLQ